MRLFKNRVFGVSSALGFVVGFAMFGTITYLPLYLQIVKGVNPTISGLWLLPMMIGLLLASVGSGQLVSRTGRYKVFPIIGTALITMDCCCCPPGARHQLARGLTVHVRVRRGLGW